LRPPALDELGLIGAILATAAQYHLPGSSRGDEDMARRLQVVVDAPEQLVRLPAAVEVAAYRIVHEALTNVMRHAQAQTCHIQLTLAEQGPQTLLCLDIIDDGCGLPRERHQGVGLVAMRERAAELGGICVVAAGPTRGTVVRARLPLTLDDQTTAPEPQRGVTGHMGMPHEEVWNKSAF
jgi:signal transduction histidine kinase